MSSVETKSNQCLVHVAPNVERISEGFVRSRISVPGLSCPECGTWTGMRRIPQPCPPEIQNFIRGQKQSPMSLLALSQLNEIWSQVRSPSSPELLYPGDMFSPVQWAPPKIGRDLYWPQYSNVVSSSRLFDLINSMTNGCLKSMEIDNSNLVEWIFTWHTADLAKHADGNEVVACKRCPMTKTIYSDQYDKLLRQQEKGKWIYRSNCFSHDLFLSHIFYPGFLTTQKVASVLQDTFLDGVKCDRIEIRED